MSQPKSGRSARSSGARTNTRASKRTTANRQAVGKAVSSKAARSPSLRGAAPPVTDEVRHHRHASQGAFGAQRKPRLAVVSGRARGRTFEGFGALTSAEREAAIRAGLPASFLDAAIVKVGASRATILAGLGIASSTAARVKQQRGAFSLQDSERLARLARLWHDAFALYETDEGTRGWLTSPVPSAGGVPLEMLGTQEGFERAHRSIMQLAYGVVA
jgi:putative toxin-antitoxin system antitoxin component (TIGR02293 family)